MHYWAIRYQVSATSKCGIQCPSELILVMLFPPFPVLSAARANQLNGALKGFQRHLGTSGSQGEVEALALSGATQRHWELRLELSIEGGHGHACIRPLGYCQGDVTIVSRKRVPPAVPD